MPNKYYHWTHKENLSHILMNGLHPERCTTRKVAVWFTTPGRSVWAALHIADRHGWDVTDMVLLELAIPRGWVKTHRHRHIKYTVRVIDPDRITVTMILRPSRESLLEVCHPHR